MPRVGEIVPTYSTAPFISESLDSALGPRFDELEAIVINAGCRQLGTVYLNYAQTHGSGHFPSAESVAVSHPDDDALKARSS
jgi:hypothetical protein